MIRAQPPQSIIQNYKTCLRDFKLQVVFDADGCLRKYESEVDILKEFYDTRLLVYQKRKDWLESELTAVSLKLSNQARFIMEKIDGKIVIGKTSGNFVHITLYSNIENKRKKEMIKILKDRGYDSDPVKAWKSSVTADKEEAEEEEEEGADKEEGPDYNYLLSMPMWSLTLEKKEELLKKRDNKVSMCA